MGTRPHWRERLRVEVATAALAQRGLRVVSVGLDRFVIRDRRSELVGGPMRLAELEFVAMAVRRKPTEH